MREKFSETAEGLILHVTRDIDGTPIADITLENDPDYGASLLWAAAHDALYYRLNDQDLHHLSKKQIEQIDRWLDI